MSKLRSLCCAALALSICLPVLCVGASAEDDTVSRVDNIVVSSSDGIEYGSSGSDYAVFYGPVNTTDADSSGGGRFIGTYTVTDPVTGAYIDIEGRRSILVEYSLNSSYPDAESVDIWGTFDGTLKVNVQGVGTYFNVLPVSCNLYVNGSLLDGIYEYGESFQISQLVGEGEIIHTVAIEYDYNDVFDLAATGGASAVRRLYFQPGQLEFNEVLSQTGLFNGLFEWLRNILSGITSGFSNVVSAITSLPERIGEAIKNLFVPTDAQMDELKTNFNGLLESKLGFVYQSISLVDGVFVELFDAVDDPDYDATFTIPAFPAFEVDGDEVSLWDESISVDIGENEVVQVVQTLATPFVIGVMIWGFVHSMHDAFYAFVGGQSLFDWVRNRKRVRE